MKNEAFRIRYGKSGFYISSRFDTNIYRLFCRLLPSFQQITDRLPIEPDCGETTTLKWVSWSILIVF